MKMKELSALTGISDRTIRYYIDDGLFIPEKHTENYEGRRSYNFSENDVKRLNQIALLRKYGFSINEIKELERGISNLKSIVDKRVAEAKQNSEEQLDEIRTLEAAAAKQPNDVDGLCELLSTPIVEQAPIPFIDEQSSHNHMLLKRSKKSLVYMVLLSVFIIIMFYIGLGAEKPIVSFKIIISPESIPANTDYIDLLIPKTSNEFFYTDNTNMDLYTLDGNSVTFSDESEIYNYYDNDDYMSYSLHYKRALPIHQIKRDFGNEEYVLLFDAEFLLYSSTMKVAYVSKNGSVLSVTNATKATNMGAMFYCDGVKAEGELLGPQMVLNYHFVMGIIIIFVFSFLTIKYFVMGKKDK